MASNKRGDIRGQRYKHVIIVLILIGWFFTVQYCFLWTLNGYKVKYILQFIVIIYNVTKAGSIRPPHKNMETDCLCSRSRCLPPRPLCPGSTPPCWRLCCPPQRDTSCWLRGSPARSPRTARLGNSPWTRWTPGSSLDLYGGLLRSRKEHQGSYDYSCRAGPRRHWY